MERGEAAQDTLRKELELTRHEVNTLKQLIAGKDALLLRKTQSLEQAKVTHWIPHLTCELSNRGHRGGLNLEKKEKK